MKSRYTMKKSDLKLWTGTIALLLSGALYADLPDPKPAIDACQGLSQGASCSLQTSDGTTVNGTCTMTEIPNQGTELLCQPEEEPPQATVTVAATDANASETGSDTGEITVTRTGNTDAALTVNYTVSGTAASGTDYQALSGNVIIQAGQTSATITVTPIDDTDIESDETVVVTLSDDTTYTVESPSEATVTIADNEEQSGLPNITPVFSLTKSGGSESTAQFQGGISVNDGDFELIHNGVKQYSDAINISAIITPENEHQGKRADIVVLGHHTIDPNDDNCDPQKQDSGYYMLAKPDNYYCTWVVEGYSAEEWCNPFNPTSRSPTVDEYFQKWDGNLNTLASLYTVTLSELVVLTADEGKTLYKDNPAYIGHVCLYFGYRLHDSACANDDCCKQEDKNCTLIFNGEPIKFSVNAAN